MDPKEILLKHFEKVVLVLFGAFFGFIVFSMVNTPPALKTNETLKKTIDDIETHMKTYAVELPKLDDPTIELAAELDPLKVPAVEAFPAWGFHRRPNFVYTFVVDKPTVHPRHFPPTDFHVVENGRGRVKLSWKASGENEFCVIQGYEVFRCEKDPKDKDTKPEDWKSIAANLDPNKTEYEDLSVQPRAKYWYRLKESALAQLDHPEIIRAKTDLPPEQRDLLAEDTKDAVSTPQDMYITIESGNATDPVNDVKGDIQCKVWVWNKTLGKFVFKNYPKIDCGQTIGELQKKFVFEKKDLGDTNFATEAVLLKVSKVRRKIKGNEREVTVATVRWKWQSDKESEDLIEKEPPEEIRKQLEVHK
jgi:hypothetical protein